MCPTHAAVGRRSGRAAILTLALVLAGAAQARAQFPHIDLHAGTLQPGELIVVDVTTSMPVNSISVTAFGTQWPRYKVDASHWRSLVGIDLDQPPDTYTLAVDVPGAPERHAERRLLVQPKVFRRRVLKVAPAYVNPPPALLARITADAEFMQAAYALDSPEPAWRDGFVRPVPNRANSSFGTRSVFNGEPRSPHAGTDFLSPAGTPIRAPAGGRVVAARDLFFTGNTVVIDHGLGVFSMLAHLSRLDVLEGQEVAPSQVVGLVGATGRVTGPHLHWALRVGAARVNALSALALLASGR